MAELFLLISYFSNIENQCCHFGLFSFSYHQQPWVYNELVYASLLCKGMNIFIHTAEKKVVLHFKNNWLLDQTIFRFKFPVGHPGGTYLSTESKFS